MKATVIINQEELELKAIDSMIANEKRHVIRNLLRSMIPIEEEHDGCF